MTGARRIWVVLAGGVTALVLALAWGSAVLLRHEAEQRAAADRRAAGDVLRLAVWRAEGLIAPVLAQEVVRPHFHYQPFYAPELAYSARGEDLPADAVRLPSPLLNPSAPWLALHFEIDVANANDRAGWSSPQVPAQDLVSQCSVAGLPHERASRCGAALDALAAAPALAPALDRILDHATRERGPAFMLAVVEPPTADLDVGPGEWSARNRSYKRQMANSRNAYGPNNDVDVTPLPAQPVAVRTSALVPWWADGQLLLVRRLEIGGARRIQGIALDWAALERAVAAEIVDLLPAARLVALASDAVQPTDGALASVPAAIDPVAPSATAAVGWTPLRIGLALAWAMVAGSLAIAMVGVARLLELNRHRLEFVGAVTHELRTPLTTFQMYTDMLVSGMVRDPEKQARYHRTLHDESLRLGHMVTNVLAYARLEDRRWRPATEPLAVGPLLDELRPALADRCARSAMALELADRTPGGACVLACRDAVERILANLVDNACKYAQGCAEPVIALHAELRGDHVAIRVCDHGPGIARADLERVFEPFRRLVRADDAPIPGIGLGLALARRWARQLGGDLVALPGPGGAFELTLRARSGA